MGSRSSNSTDQTVNNNDRRVAVQDGIGVSGDGNTIDASTHNSMWLDASNRSTTNNTTNNSMWLDASNRSTTDNSMWLDSSNRSTNNTTITTTDHGAVTAALANSEAATRAAIGATSNALNEALASNVKAQAGALDFGVKVVDNAFDAITESQHISAKIGGDALAKVAEVNRLAVSEVAGAWNNAKAAADGKSLGDFKYLIWAAGAVVLLLVWKKG